MHNYIEKCISWKEFPEIPPAPPAMSATAWDSERRNSTPALRVPTSRFKGVNQATALKLFMK